MKLSVQKILQTLRQLLKSGWRQKLPLKKTIKILIKSLCKKPYLHRVLWERKNPTQKKEAEDDDYEGPGNEGYDPDGKNGAILMDIYDEDQDKSASNALQ